MSALKFPSSFRVAMLACFLSFAGGAVAAPGRIVVALPAAPEIAAEDAAREAAGLPWRFAIPEAVRVTPRTHGDWTTGADGGRAWRLEVASPGATSLNLGFPVFWLPAGATLTVRAASVDASAFVFDAGDNADHGQLWTPVVPGDLLVLELAVPASVRVEPLLELGFVNSGYRGLVEEQAGKSGSCNVDVVCAEGDDWRDEIATVGVLTLNGSLKCSGAMVNNTSYDGTPFFLTANHCGITSELAPTVVVYWNFESPTCGQHGGGPLTQFTSGSTLRATWSASDFTLVELDEVPDPAYGVKYAGWNRGATPPTSATAIHHPDTDEKSISFENDPLTSTSYLLNAVPGDGSHLRVEDWDLGTTEPGSSGSPLFDQDHLVVGQLHGGFAACDNNLSDWYGWLNRSWNGGGTAATRLSDWLDAAGTGATTLPLLDPASGEYAVSPAELPAASGPPGGPFEPASWEFTLANAGDEAAMFAVSADREWLEVSPAAGIVPAGGQVAVTAALGAGASSLATGRHEVEVTFTNNALGTSVTRMIALDVIAPVPTIIGASPNPFRGFVTVEVSLPVAGAITWRVHDLRGRLVRGDRTLAGEAGQNVVAWDGRGDDGRRLPAGAYVVTIAAGGREARVQVTSAH